MEDETTRAAGLRERSRPLLQLLRRMLRVGRGLSTVAVIATIAGPLLGLAFTIASGLLVGAVPGAVRDGWDSPAGRSLVVRLVATGLIFIADYMTGLITETASGAVGRRVDRRIRRDVLAAALAPESIAHLEDPKMLDQISMARGTGLQHFTVGQAATGATTLVGRAIGIAGAAAIVASFRWWLPVMVLGVLLWLRWAMRRHIATTLAAMIDSTGAVRRASYYTDLAMRPDAAKENRVFGLGEWLGARLRLDLLTALRPIWADRSRSRRRLYLPLLVSLFALAFANLVVVDAALSGSIDLARLTILLSAVGGLSGALNYENADLMVQQGTTVLPVIESLIEKTAEPSLHLSGDQPATGLPARSIRFEGVGFRYPGSTRERVRRPRSGAAGRRVAGDRRRERRRQDHARQAARPALRPDGRSHHRRRHRPPPIDPRRGSGASPPSSRTSPATSCRRATTSRSAPSSWPLTTRRCVAPSSGPARSTSSRRSPTAGTPRCPGASRGGTDLSGGQWQRIALARALLAVEGGAGDPGARRADRQPRRAGRGRAVRPVPRAHPRA